MEVKIAACKCLHSLSRSTKLLRTTIVDTEAWKYVLEVRCILVELPSSLSPLSAPSLSPLPLSLNITSLPPLWSLKMLSLRDEECLTVATGVSANLLLAFSPSREVYNSLAAKRFSQRSL